jgi:hypothetical protein
MRATPHQVVTKSFENRAALVAKLAELVDKQHGDTSVEDVKSRLMGLPNKKLLRLYQVEQKVRERFGDREKLVDHIIAKRKAAGLTADDTYRAKLDASSKARLLDIARQRHPDKPKKLTPEQRLARKNGRKQRARALQKLGKA